MQYLKTYTKTIADRGNIELAKSIEKTAEKIFSSFITNFSFCTHEIGLLFGNVQSGKTGQMFGIISKATDIGFPAFLILTTDNVSLQQQTLERVKNDLKGYCVCGENDSGLFVENMLIKPVIVVLKKNARVLKLWANIFSSTGFMIGNPLFIIDDEADAASLNTLINKGSKSTIHKYLDTIKNGASSSIYLQVTGTPQAILLQSMASGWRPFFSYYFDPGDQYLGGDFFFPENETPECIKYLDNCRKSEQCAVVHHLAVSGQILSTGGGVSNFLIHPSVRQSDHNKFVDKIKNILSWCRANIDQEFKTQLESAYKELKPTNTMKADFENVYETVKDLLLNKKVNVILMNGTNVVLSDKYSIGSNVIIGGNSLGRGITFPGLHTIYYTRTSKHPQADTIWQHSRMFGYDRDPGMMQVYMDEALYKTFKDINSTNNSLISQIQNGIEKIKVYYPAGLRPTRPNVLDKKKVFVLTGGTNYFPFDPDNDTIDQLDSLLEGFNENTKYYQVSVKLLKEIFTHIVSGEDFSVRSFIAVMDSILSEQSYAQGILIVRRNRDITKGTGALLSPNDWNLGAEFKKQIVVTMYKVTGNKSWNNKQLWVPNIKLPDNIDYYDVKD